MWTIPNLLSLSRLVVAPILLGLAVVGKETLVLSLFAYCVVSDVLDGRLAHVTRTTSEFGAKLDSIADCAFYLTAPFAAVILYPWLREKELATFVLIFAGYLAPITFGWLKFRTLTSYHTVAARVAGVGLYVGFAASLSLSDGWPLRIATALLLISALEEIMITATLRVPRTNIPSWLRLRPAEREIV